MGSGDCALPFILLADLPPVPKPFPKDDCTEVSLWTPRHYRDLLNSQNEQVGGTDGNSSASSGEQGRRHHKKLKPTHPYLQNKDGTPVNDLSVMSTEVRMAWQSLHKRKMAPKTFGKISTEAWEFIARSVLPNPKLEFLLYCDDGQWKLKEWCKQNYSSWTRNQGLRPPAVKNTESVDDILNNTKLIRMKDSNADNNGEDSDEDSEDSDSDEDDEDDKASTSITQKVRILSIAIHYSCRL